MGVTMEEEFIIGETYMTKTQVPEPVTLLEFLGDNSVYVSYNNNPEIGKCLLEKSRLKLKEKPIKITFGLQQKQIDRIEEHSKYYDTLIEEGDILKPGWMQYDKYFWEKLGDEFGWEAFTLALHWFEYKNNNYGNK